MFSAVTFIRLNCGLSNAICDLALIAGSVKGEQSD